MLQMMNKSEAALRAEYILLFRDGQDLCNPGYVHENSLQQGFCNAASDPKMYFYICEERKVVRAEGSVKHTFFLS
jgi:hypothetical protein